MKVSVIIVSYNVAELLARCLRSLLASAGPDLEIEAVVVDNASSDGSAERVRKDFPQVRLHDSGENLGFSKAVNIGASISGGELLLLLNPDTELQPGALRNMLRSFEAFPQAAALGVRQVDEGGFLQLSVGPRPSLWGEWGRRWVQRRLDARALWMASWIDRCLAKPCEVPWVAGSCLLVRRQDFEKIDGFDEGFFLFFEDIDFCLRLGTICGPVLYDPTITIVHHRGASAQKDPGLADRAYRASQGYFWQKHGGPVSKNVVRAYLGLRSMLSRA